MSIPAPRVPLGEPSNADKTRAADRLSIATGLDIRPGSFAARALAVEYAQSYRAGYEAGLRDATQAATA